jgi:hypothetical protein
VEAAVEETLTYYAFPEEHWRRIRTNNPLERILREIRRRTRVVGAFPDGQSALNLAAARLRHIAGTAWSTKRYLNIELLCHRRRNGRAEPASNCCCRGSRTRKTGGPSYGIRQGVTWTQPDAVFGSLPGRFCVSSSVLVGLLAAPV